MSAFVVQKAHIDALINAALGTARDNGGRFAWHVGEARHELRSDNADEVGAMLWAENERSVAYRYGDDLPGPTPTPEAATYRVTWAHHQIDPVCALMAVACYEYQTCEHPEWREPGNVARAFCDELRRDLVSDLPGYNLAAGWEVRSLASVTPAAQAARVEAHRERLAREGYRTPPNCD